MRQHIYELHNVIEHTWPAYNTRTNGSWTLREGRGGGKRVSATTLDGFRELPNLKDAEQGMQALSQTPIFMIREGEGDLDYLLATEGYEITGPSNIYMAPIEEFAKKEPPRLSVFDIWEPLQIQNDIWSNAGIGASRTAVMHRVKGPKTSFFLRWKNNPAGTAFIGIHNNIAMVHAMEILPQHRRKSVATLAMYQAAIWAKSFGAHTLSVICTKENLGANALYASLHMQLVGGYHYRIKKEIA